MTNDNVKNLPIVDKRLIDFTENLYEWILKNGEDLPFVSVVGAIDVVKNIFILDGVVGE